MAYGFLYKHILNHTYTQLHLWYSKHTPYILPCRNPANHTEKETQPPNVVRFKNTPLFKADNKPPQTLN
jgi:hypothetical protein